ncbi:MAG: EAL domain-containing protein [Rhizobiaceae bacterium]
MSRQGEFAQISQNEDGTRVAVWGIFKLHSAFQPIFAFNSDGRLEIMAFECLIRPFREGAAVPPHRFFSSVPPEERVEVETLMRNLHLLNAGTFIDPSALIFVNFDPSQFAKTENIEAALRGMRLVLHEANIDRSRIVCELTEQKSASPLALKNLMMALRNHGFRIAVDDFGAEDSDFDRIIQMNPDIVKFDAEWVIKLLRSAAGYTLLKSMITKVTERGIQTVIEGVEEPWQLELSEKAGALMVQGFGIARPQIAPSEFAIRAAPVPTVPRFPVFQETAELTAAPGGPQSVFGRRS